MNTEILQNNNKIKERIKEIDDLTFQEEQIIKELNDKKNKNNEELSQNETKYKLNCFK